MCLLGPCAACPNALPAKIVALSISICHRGAYNQGCDAPRISGLGKRAPSLKAGGVSARTVNTWGCHPVRVPFRQIAAPSACARRLWRQSPCAKGRYRAMVPRIHRHIGHIATSCAAAWRNTINASAFSRKTGICSPNHLQNLIEKTIFARM